MIRRGRAIAPPEFVPSVQDQSSTLFVKITDCPDRPKVAIKIAPAGRLLLTKRSDFVNTEGLVRFSPFEPEPLALEQRAGVPQNIPGARQIVLGLSASTGISLANPSLHFV